ALGNRADSHAAAHYLGHLAGLEFGDSEHLAGALDDAQALRDRALAYLAECFKGMATQLPVLILVDDLHWADDSSLDALNHLSLALRDQPVMIACTARPPLFERRPHWGEGQPFHSRLALRPLSKWDSRRLVVEILQKLPEVPRALRDLIVAGAEGNPFYIEELVKMQIEDSVIVKEEERWRLDPARLAKVRVPESLTGVLQARLDRLPPEERIVLQQASVVGRLFWDRAVARIRESTGKALEPGKLAEKLSELRDRELVYRRETSAFVDAQEYIFKHTLLREVTYDSVLKRLRRTYHGVVADWLLEQGGDRVGELAALIADHLALAGRATEAIDHLLQAGDRARNLYAHQEAIRAYERGLALLRELGDNKGVAQTLLKLGLVYTAAFQPDKAQEVYREAFTLWESMPEARGPSELPVSTALLRFAVTEPSTLDPGTAGDDPSTFMVAQLFEGLVSVDADYNVLPAVAARWEVHDGGQRYLFRLREGLRWSDGLPLTAADFEYAWKRNLAPALRSPLAHLLYVLENARAFGEGAMHDPDRVGVAALDDLTLEVRLEGPTAYLPHLLALPIAYPLPRRVLEGIGQSWTVPGNLVSNGAYQLEEWQRGERLVLCRNPYYYGRFSGNAHRVECPVFTDSAPVLEAYAADDLHGISMIMTDPGTTARAHAAHGGELIFTPQPSTPYLVFRADWPPFDDVRVRRAFVQAVDREALAKEAWQGQYLPATGGFIPPGMPGHSAGISPAYNPEQARRLLVQAGYPNGPEFPAITWLCPGSSADNPVIPFLRTAWHSNLGVNLEAQSLDWGAYIERRKRDPANLALSGWLADYPDPDSLLRVVFHSTEGINPGRWHNRRFDALVEEAARLADQTRRMALYQEADRILVAEEAAIIPLGYGQGRTLVKPWVTIPRVPPALMRFKHVVLQRPQR
ncbi:MAG: ABC transporter substrate-binding protein, partial [Promethearchaeota archaeon]